MSVLRRARRLGPLAATTVFLAACASDAPQDTFKPEGEYARDIDRLIDPVFAVAGVVFVLVLGGALLIGLKFRARDDEHYDDMPSQIHGNNALEIGWTILPALILLAVGVASVVGIFKLNETPPEGSVEVQVVGQQWWWEYRYDLNDDGVYDEVVTANELVIPAGEKVALEITARDVIHSFWAPRLNGKRDAVPNRSHPWNIQADEPGEYVGQCTEFCGLSHAEMRIKVIALTADGFDRWADGQQRQAATLGAEDTSLAGQGYALFNQQLCSSCHLIEGVNDKKVPNGVIADRNLQMSRHAPNLTHLMSRTTFAGAKFDLRKDTPECRKLGITWADDPDDLTRCLDRAALEAWLRNPPGEKAMSPDPVPGTSGGRGMPNLNLDEAQIDQLIAYLTTLK
ncbi:MAG: cytochrome c oxidase subunit II [Iamia sp.]